MQNAETMFKFKFSQSKEHKIVPWEIFIHNEEIYRLEACGRAPALQA
jgi:hypothetical protein